MADNNGGEIIIGIQLDTESAEKQLKDLSKRLSKMSLNDTSETWEKNSLKREILDSEKIKETYVKLFKVSQKIQELQSSQAKGTEKWKEELTATKTEYWNLLKLLDTYNKTANDVSIFTSEAGTNDPKLKFNYYKKSFLELAQAGMISKDALKDYLYVIEEMAEEDETLIPVIQKLKTIFEDFGIDLGRIFPQDYNPMSGVTKGVEEYIQANTLTIQKARKVIEAYATVLKENNGIIDNTSDNYNKLSDELLNFVGTTEKGKENIKGMTQAFIVNANSLNNLVSLGLLSKNSLLYLREAMRELNFETKQENQSNKTLNVSQQQLNYTRDQSKEIIEAYNAVIKENNGIINTNSEAYKKFESLLEDYVGWTTKAANENIDLGKTFVQNASNLNRLATSGYLTKVAASSLQEELRNLTFEEKQQAKQTAEAEKFIRSLGSAFRSSKTGPKSYSKQVKSLTANIKTLNSNLKNVYFNARNIAKGLLTFFGLNKFFQSLSDVTDAFKSYEQSEQKLQALMKSRMAATNDDVKSVEDLIDAQTDLGIISRNAQLAGAQQLATYTTTRESLERLIPVMNNAAAQAYGVNASQADLVSSAKLFGKAINGQTEALKRAGYAISAYDENLLETGNEQQRVDALVRIITNRVGNMNEVLAQTDSGKQKQLANTMEEVQVEFGRAVSTIKTVLIPALAVLVRILSNVAAVLNRFANTIRAVFGKSKSNIAGAADDMKDYADATTEAASATEDLLGPYDKLNVIKKSDADEDATDYTGLNSALVDMTKTIDDVDAKWMAFLEKFKKGDWFGVGFSISSTISDSLNNIDWNSIKEGGKKFGYNLGQFLNGLLTEDMFKSIGSTVGELVNTVIATHSAFYKTANWSAWGSNLAAGINEFFRTVDFKEFTEGVNAFLNGMIDFIASFLTHLDYGEILKSLGTVLANLDYGAVATIFAAIFATRIVKRGIALAFNAAKEHLLQGLVNLLLSIKGSQTVWAGATEAGTAVGATTAGAISTGVSAGILGVGAAIIAGLGIAIGYVKKETAFWAEYEEWLKNACLPTAGWQEKIDTMKGMIDDLVADSQDRMSKFMQADDEYEGLGVMADRYFELAQQTNRTADEQAEMVSLYKALAKNDALVGILTAQNLTLEEQKERIDDVIASLKLKAQQEATYDLMVEAYKKQAEAAKVAEDATLQYNQALEEWSDAKAKYEKGLEEFQKSEIGRRLKMLGLDESEIKSAYKRTDAGKALYEAYSHASGAVNETKRNSNQANDAVEQLDDEIQQYANTYSQATQQMSQDAKTATQDTVNATQDTLNNGIPGVKTASDNFFGTVGNSANTELNKDKGKISISNFIEGLKTKISSSREELQDKTKKLIEIITSTTKNNLSSNTGKTSVSNFIDGLKDKIVSSRKELQDRTNQLIDRITSTTKNNLSSDTGKTYGGYFIDGLKNGLSMPNKLKEIADVTLNLAKAITNPFTKFFRMHSPSRLFRDYGEYVDEGFVIGVDRKSAQVGNAMQNLSQIAADNFDLPNLMYGNVLPANGNFVSTVTTGISKTTSNILTGLDERLQQMLDSEDKDIIIQIDGKEIFKVVKNKNDEYINRTGNSAFR